MKAQLNKEVTNLKGEAVLNVTGRVLESEGKKIPEVRGFTLGEIITKQLLGSRSGSPEEVEAKIDLARRIGENTEPDALLDLSEQDKKLIDDIMNRQATLLQWFYLNMLAEVNSETVH